MRRVVVAVAVACGLAACASWRPASLAEIQAPHPVRRRYQLWIGGESHWLHAVYLTPDSIYGIPYFQSPDCRECTVGFLRSRVDSVRVLKGGETAGRSAMGMTGVLLLVLFAASLGGIVYVAGAP